jgi:osmotically-inducible protein OsmY
MNRYDDRYPRRQGYRGESRYSESQFGQRRDPRETYERDYGREEYRRRQGSDERYGSGDFGYEGGRRGEPSFGEDEQQPRYFGTGNYSEGGTHYTGGFDERATDESTLGYARGDYGYGYEDRDRQREPRRSGTFQRAFKQGPKGYQRSDERLKEDISERLMQAHEVDSSDVTVNVVSGKVTFDGTVPDRYMKHYIEDLADSCPGVQDIDNRIRVAGR